MIKLIELPQQSDFGQKTLTERKKKNITDLTDAFWPQPDSTQQRGICLKDPAAYTLLSTS